MRLLRLFAACFTVAGIVFSITGLLMIESTFYKIMLIYFYVIAVAMLYFGLESQIISKEQPKPTQEKQ